MNDLINNQAAEVVEESDEMMDSNADVAETQTSVDDIKKVYFASAQLEEAQAELAKVAEITDEHELDTVYNFDPDKDFPTGYGIAIIPIAKRIDGENTVLGVAVAAIPDLETVAEHSGGSEFIKNAVVGNMMAKLANAVRPRGDSGESSSSIPFDVEDFITSNRPEGVLLAYREFASGYVKVLKKKGLKLMTETILRQVLQSAAFAEQQFPKISQDKWEKILDTMIARAEEKGIAPGMLVEWRNTRDSAELQDRDVDLSDLDFDEI